jgi:hypothetical protein
MTDQATQLQLLPSSNAIMSNFLLDAETRSEQAARQNLMTALTAAGTNPEAYTTPQLRAMVKLEQLKLVGDLELEAILLRGKIIQQAESEGLWSIHPNQYSSMQEAAVANGLSLSEYSDIRNLFNIVFPYITGTLGLELATIWEEVGKSNFRELTPILVRLISGTRSQSNNVENYVAGLTDDIRASYQAAGQEVTDEHIQQEAIEQLIQAGQLPNRELRQTIRPERTPSITAYLTEIGFNGANQKVIISVVDDDQLSMFRRRMTGYVDTQPVDFADLVASPLGRMLSGEAQ